MVTYFPSVDAVVEFCHIFGRDALDYALKSHKLDPVEFRMVNDALALANNPQIDIKDFDDGNNWKHTYITFNPQASNIRSFEESVVLHIDTNYGCKTIDSNQANNESIEQYFTCLEIARLKWQKFVHFFK